ncbi:hypothetical protein VUR80DRAFT_5857 [Thermomyces stellatus]
MYNSRPHPLLQQVPLTVSPFVALPSGPTLPYNYQQMPSTLPASILNPPPQDPSAPASSTPPKPRYVVSNTGHAAHPDDIAATCREMHAHLAAMQEDAERDLAELQEAARRRELAEKRRIAPGWLDSEVRVLEPEKKEVSRPGERADAEMAGTEGAGGGEDEGAELDRAFGSMKVS